MTRGETNGTMRIFRTIRVLGRVVGYLAVAATPVLVADGAWAMETDAREALLLDMSTNAVLFAKSADDPMPPASMSKMMTVYMVFERLRDGRLSLDDKLTVSPNAWRKGGAKSGSSTMFLDPGAEVRVEDVIQGIVVQSGNDACITVAEALSGTEEAFAEEMTQRSHELGMVNSTFRNATGWPDPEHLTTAHDLALLTRKTIENFPEYFRYYSEKSFTYNGIRQSNRNPLLYKDLGADGMKTGHTEVSGYGLTGTAKQGDRRLILVINGLKSIKDRTLEAERLMAWGFREFSNYSLLKAGEEVSKAEVWLGEESLVPLVIDQDLTITLPRKSRKEMKVVARYEGPIAAPIAKGQKLAELVVSAPDVSDVTVPLLAGADVAQLGMMSRLGAALGHILWGGEAR